MPQVPPGPDHFRGHIARSRTFSGPVSFLNPTTRYVTFKKGGPPPGTGPHRAFTAPVSEEPAAAAGREGKEGAFRVWRSRDNRKGRHAVTVSPEYAAQAGAACPPPTNSLRETLRGLGKMVMRYPVWDVSYDVATIFTLGSVVWVINGFFVWYPLQNPASEFPNEASLGGGITALIGATIFEFGSVLLMLEAVNENRADCFGWAVGEALETGMLSLHPSHDGCRHSHARRGAWLKGKGENGTTTATATATAGAGEREGASDSADESGGSGSGSGAEAQKPSRKWSWWPSGHELRTHYFRDIGFLACFSQMIGATVFWISGFTGLPPIFNALSVPAANGIFWLPQVIGGTGFIISSSLFMLETQTKWYLPAPKILGWHIGLWNLIGAIGFTLCGAMGFAIDQDGIEYASTLATFIGSWAFLIGSVIQWYESLDKYPISIDQGLAAMTEG